MPDNKSIVQLCKYIKTDQELIRLQRYLLAGKVEPGKTAGSVLYKLCKERRMGYLLGGNNRQTDSDKIKGQIARIKNLEEISGCSTHMLPNTMQRSTYICSNMPWEPFTARLSKRVRPAARPRSI